MAVPHFRVSVVSRGGGRSALATAAYDAGQKLSSSLASAAYISGERLLDEQADKVFDYSRKENIRHTEIVLPLDSPTQFADRQTLWASVESAEKRKDAQLCRSIIAALPRELNDEQQLALVRRFVRNTFTDSGMICDFAIHDKDAKDGENNPHVHMLLTLRDVSKNGFGKKNRDWNNPAYLQHWRNEWEAFTNRYLAAAGHNERVSLKSYEEQGIDKIPQQHLGYGADALEKKGELTRVGTENRKRKQRNAVRDTTKGYAASPAYTQEEIDQYYRAQAEPNLYDPDQTTLDTHRQEELLQRKTKPPEGHQRTYWQRTATHSSQSTWYGQTSSKATIKWQKIANPNSLIEHEAQRHARMVRAALAQSDQFTLKDTWDRIVRMGKLAKEKALTQTRTIFERYAGWGELTAKGYDRGMER